MVYLLVSWLFRFSHQFLGCSVMSYVAVTRLLAVQSDVIYGSVSSFLAAQ